MQDYSIFKHKILYSSMGNTHEIMLLKKEKQTIKLCMQCGSHIYIHTCGNKALDGAWKTKAMIGIGYWASTNFHSLMLK